ncbi:MAG TPA: hypothetical protein PKC67_01865 [Kiritimatiellia bacterium]|nr:hypothetical protein [Kiritimatiellia bacterium]HMP33070.1 hypothetical protein [Kiritimatiellia bacterium]
MHVRSTLLLLALLTAPAVFAADGFFGLRLSSPLIASGTAGVKFGDDDGGLRPTIQAEAGVGGGKLAVGLDGTGHGKVGFGVKAAMLRTWIEPIDVDDNQTFLGVELEASIKRLLLSTGGYRRVGDGDDDWLGTAGVGFLF